MEADAQLPGDVAAFFRAYGRIVAVLDGAVGRLTPAEAALLITAHQSGGVSMPFDPSVRQVIDEGVVQTVPQLGTTAVIYRLTALGDRVLAAHHTALVERAAAGDTTFTPKQVTDERAAPLAADHTALHTLLDQAERGQPIDHTLIAQARQELASMGDSGSRAHASSALVVDMVPIPWNQPSYRQTPVYQHTLACAVCDKTVTVQTHRSQPPPVCDRDDCRATHIRLQARDRKRRQRAREQQKEDAQER